MDRGVFRQVLIGLTCNLLIIDSGLMEGWSTPTIPKFNNGDPLEMTTNEIAWAVNMLYVGAGLGAIVPFLLMDRIGRKGTLLFAVVPKIASWILIGLAEMVPLLYLGRVLAGIGCGITYSVMPMYLGEISSKRTRGPLGTLVAVLLNVGMLLIYAIGVWVSRFTMAMMGLVVPFIFAATFVWMPESSIYLTRKNKMISAERNLQWLLAKEDVGEELEEIKRIATTEKDGPEMTFLQSVREAYSRPGHRRAFGIALIVMSALILTGSGPILAYQSHIFEAVGFEISMDASIAMSGVAIVLAGMACVMFVRKLGKRTLLLISAPLCLVALVVLATFFTLFSREFNIVGYKWVPTVFLLIYAICFGLALNPIPIAYVGEIFHMDVKVPGAIFCALYYSIGTTFTVKLYQVLEECYGIYAPLWVFAVITFHVWLLIYRYVPETEGKTLEEIQTELNRKK